MGKKTINLSGEVQIKNNNNLPPIIYCKNIVMCPLF